MADKTVSGIFDGWQAKLAEHPEQAQAIGAVYQWVITGDGGGSWVLDCVTPAVRSGEDTAAQCKITLSGEDFIAMESKTVPAPQLFMQGRMLIEGDMSLALRLQQVFDAIS